MDEAKQRLLEPGRNCWRLEQATRAAVLVDAANYYRWLHESLSKARHSILIVGWDFDGGICLRPDGEPGERRPLGEFLRALVEERPTLTVSILIWSVAVLHAPGAPLPLLLGEEWQNHPRIRLKLDTQHPLYAAHHQKIVAIDGTVAYVGGIDLTIRRWDTCDHCETDPLRRSPDGTPYSPVHDIQMVVEGEAALAVSKLAGRRWETATGELPPAATAADSAWPDGLEPEFRDLSIGIARTFPAWGTTAQVRETAALTLDVIRSVQRMLYIEAQYFTAPVVGREIAKRLREARGPEIVVILTLASRGLIEHGVMGENRDRLVRRLRREDRFGRFRVYFPVVAGAKGDCPVLIHSKLMIADDRFLRVGSANLNNRSIGLDTECDLALEGEAEAARRAIVAVRDGLLAEHLGRTPDEVARAVAASGSLIGAIDALNTGRRALRTLHTAAKGPTHPVLATWLLDPVRPFEPLWFLKRKRHSKSVPA